MSYKEGMWSYLNIQVFLVCRNQAPKPTELLIENLTEVVLHQFTNEPQTVWVRVL